MSVALIIAPPTSTPVPAEARGRARVFRNEVKAIDVQFDAAIALIVAPLRERLRRHSKLRPEHPSITAVQYDRLIPTEFRIGPITGTRHKTSFAIEETRVVVSWLTCDDWHDPDEREPGVTVCKFTFSVHDGRLRQRWRPITNVSLHALARRVARGRDRSHDAMFRDIALLPAADADGERVDTIGGYWLGRTIDAMGEAGRVFTMRSVRTWLDA